MKRRGYIPLKLTKADEYKVRCVLAGKMCDLCSGTIYPLKDDTSGMVRGMKVCVSRRACEARQRVAQEAAAEARIMPRPERHRRK